MQQTMKITIPVLTSFILKNGNFIKIYVFLLLSCNISQTLPAQDSHPIAVPKPLKCKTPKISFENERLYDKWHETNRSPSQVDKLVRVYFHISRNTDGTSAAATLAQIQNEFNILVEDFAGGNICFAFMGFDFIDNTTINWSIDPDVQADVDLLLPFIVPNCLNIYYHNDLEDVGGSAYAIPNHFCSIASGNINLWRTISHEVGHCLGLYHTFETAFGTAYINGSSCNSNGDKVCDTSADPDPEGACFNSGTCNYTGSCTDPGGSSNYSPPYDNIMSYWGIESCTLTTLTSGQYDRAHYWLANYPILLLTQSPNSLIYGPKNTSSGYELKSAIGPIVTNGSVTLSNSVEASFVGQNIKVLPGFTAAPTSGSILIKPGNCAY